MRTKSVADPTPRSSAERLANALGSEPGERAEKVAFCERNLRLWTEEAKAAGITKREALNAKIVALAIRWWRQEQRNPSGARASPGVPSDAELEARMAEHNRKLAAGI
jgi:hypothetical protein